MPCSGTLGAMRTLLLAAALLGLASTASAQVASSVHAPTPSTPTYEQRVRTALGMIATGDRATAMTGLREAIALQPTRPEAMCALAEGYRAGGDFTAALDNFQTCLRLAREVDDVLHIARALHGVASCFERMPEHMNDARNAWMEYARFADGATRVASAATGRERVQAIDVVTEQERVYVDVRARIAERERIASQPPPPPAPPPAATRSRGPTGTPALDAETGGSRRRSRRSHR